MDIIKDKLILSSIFYDEVDNLIDTYKKNGIFVTNLSGWNPSEKYIRTLMKAFDMPIEIFDPINYFYTYQIDESVVEQIKKKLKLHDDRKLIFFNSNTNSIVCSAYYIKKMQYKKILIICPSYFTVFESLKEFSVDFDQINLIYKDGSFTLPDIDILKKYEIIWYTNPVFCYSQYLSEYDLKKISILLETGVKFIFDEVLSEQFIENSVYHYKNIISIISPHKKISFNGTKFSVLSIDNSLLKFFNHWNEIYNGSLPQSTVNSITHFLSDNYDALEELNREFITKAYFKLKNLMENYSEHYILSQNVGYYVTITSKYICFNDKTAVELVHSLIRKIHSFIAPSQLFYNKVNFLSFRINMLMYDERFIHNIKKILDFIVDYYQKILH